MHAQVLNSQPLNYSNDPLYGETELEAGFLPDPAIALLRAGGITDAREIIEGCVGYITSEQPDWRVISSLPPCGNQRMVPARSRP